MTNSSPKREQLRVESKRGILAAVVAPETPLPRDRVLEELRGLAETAGVEVVGELVQYRETPHPSTCLGSGKVEELARMAKAQRAEVILFDNNLTPAQGRNLEKATDTVIVDRSELILDIFASRARTYEAKLQVELAQLQYFRPRLKRLWTHLERIEGGVGAGRGPGEKQLETDRRLLDKRVAELKRKLREVERRRSRMVQQRRDQVTVSLVGYTNAGKSTLMRALTGSDVYVADKLFATLDTRTRRWRLPHWGDVLLSDTVGFVRDLPPHLVASFRSTLEEARHAELLLHVVDISHPEAAQQIQTVYSVLADLGVDSGNTVLVLNKIDRVDDRSVIDIVRSQYPLTVTVSAATGYGLDALTEAVTERLSRGFVDALIEAPAEDGSTYAFLASHGQIRQTACTDGRMQIRCRIARRFLERLPEDGRVRVVSQEPSEGRAVANASESAASPSLRAGA